VSLHSNEASSKMPYTFTITSNCNSPQISVRRVHFNSQFVVFEHHRDGPVLFRHSEQLVCCPLYDAEAERPADLHSVNEPRKRHVRLCENNRHIQLTTFQLTFSTDVVQFFVTNPSFKILLQLPLLNPLYTSRTTKVLMI